MSLAACKAFELTIPRSGSVRRAVFMCEVQTRSIDGIDSSLCVVLAVVRIAQSKSRSFFKLTGLPVKNDPNLKWAPKAEFYCIIYRDSQILVTAIPFLPYAHKHISKNVFGPTDNYRFVKPRSLNVECSFVWGIHTPE